ncbi:hypothetical protein TRFO_20122 [Tritrichomonas foetus]|uniref:Uncharacterized protein n=1 Tax=Tritrichomonas foetus TaxID=1144522 RepID=A0A1J4KGL0_9EUKA|nr:hypothetical protein TRFO_20122 [Tritrichomonas foetus]|eukprot:OHT10535.1 hypothetical protein TRFO_20122 [Tritrichomonas foetus]
MIKKVSKTSARKREKSTPAKAVDFDKNDDSLDCTDIIQKLEAENRILKNKFRDLEFELEEATIQNEILTKSLEKPVKSKQIEQQEFNIDELKQTVLDLTRQKNDEEARSKYSQYVVKEKEADIEFIRLEMSELQSINSSIDEQKSLERQLAEMESELKTNDDQLMILQNEENNAIENMKTRKGSMKNKINHNIKPPQNWEEERNEIQRRHQQIHHKYEKLEEKERETNDHFTALKSQFYYELGLDEKELKKAIYAEIEFNTNQTVMNLQNSIATEIEYNNILENELNEVRKSTSYIKKYREVCFQRGRNQYVLESSRKRLELLQEKLNEISSNISSTSNSTL